jgi:hypothetical protein
VSDGKRISTLPIGIENIRYGVNGFPSDMKSRGGLKINKVLVGPFGLTHSDRLQAFNNFNVPNEAVDLITERLSPKNFSNLMQEYNYVAAVRGNGVDTHRLWESLYRGVAPILKNNAWSKSLKSYNLPISYVSNWDLPSMQHLLTQSPISFESKTLPALWWPYWKQKINEYL